MKRPVSTEMLRERLDALVATFDISTITPDPLELVLRYNDPRDQEVAGLIAAAFAYGRADIVVANVGRVLDRMLPSPFAYLSAFQRERALSDFAGFVQSPLRFQLTVRWASFFASATTRATRISVRRLRGLWRFCVAAAFRPPSAG
ncbi:MAG: hypothetical protein DMF58_20425 [Acidobacteria bacterium]|nr:MAG: hypothetical protein DMF58_20425 [Acidobacteriota bacterium]